MRYLVACALAAVVAGWQASAAAEADAPAPGVGLAVMSYFPAENGWTLMWTRWRPRAIARDLGSIRALGADTVRIVVAPVAFGYPEPRAMMIARLRRVVELAAARELRVQLTLFDWWGHYDDLEGSRRWAAAVLAPLAGDRRIAFVELQNELDPRREDAVRWARELVPHVRAVSRRPVAMSAVGPPAAALTQLAAGLRDVRPDLFSAHYFGPSELAHVELAAAVAAVAPTPVILGETGYSTAAGNRAVPGVPATPAAREAAQDHYLRAMAVAARSLGLGPPAPWVFSDFRPTAIPPAWNASSIERHYGLVRVDGTAKPAAASVRATFAGRTVSRAFNNGFEAASSAARRAVPVGWQIRGGRNARVRRDAQGGRDATAAARIASVRGRPTGRPALYVAPLEIVRPGRRYVAAVWARGEGAIGLTRIALGWHGAGGELIARAESRALGASTGEWERLRVRSPAPSGAAFVRVYLESEGSRGSVWFDDVAFGRAG